MFSFPLLLVQTPDTTPAATLIYIYYHDSFTLRQRCLTHRLSTLLIPTRVYSLSSQGLSLSMFLFIRKAPRLATFSELFSSHRERDTDGCGSCLLPTLSAHSSKTLTRAHPRPLPLICQSNCISTTPTHTHTQGCTLPHSPLPPPTHTHTPTLSSLICSRRSELITFPTPFIIIRIP